MRRSNKILRLINKYSVIARELNKLWPDHNISKQMADIFIKRRMRVTKAEKQL